MIVLSIHFNELRIKILADLAEDIAETLNGISIKQFAPVFSYEDQMYMQIKYTMPAVSYVLPFVHRPSIVCVMSIACNKCGRRKKIQRLGKRASWTCSGCSKGPRVLVSCFRCKKTVFVPACRVVASDYYLCGPCEKSGHEDIEGLKNPEQIIIWKVNAAGEMNGFDIRYPTPEEARSVERAKAVLNAGLKKVAELTNPYIN